MSFVSEEDIKKYSGKEIFRPSLRSLVGRKKLVGAEVGVARGENSRMILQNLNIRKLYLIDSYRLYKGYTNRAAKLEWMAQRNLAKWQRELKWLKMFSKDAAKHIKKGELDFVYIDANHEYEYVKKDLKLYYPKVKLNGIIAGHDYQLDSVIKAVDEFFPEGSVCSAICRIEQRRRKQLVWIDWWVFKNEKLVEELRNK